MEKCGKNNCTHYVDKMNLRLYKGKFLIAVVIVTVVIAILFGCEVCFYHSSLQHIVDKHSTFVTKFEKSIEPLTISKDSCVYANDQLVNSMREYMQSTQNILELQSDKIQADFTLLSLWAGILMIVFLIFSIYSMFKTDELMKQGREGLRAIEASKAKADEQVETIDKKVEGEIQKVTDAASREVQVLKDKSNESINQLIESIQGEKDNFNSIVAQKAEDFQKVYEDYVKKLGDTTKQVDSFMKLLMQVYNNSQQESSDNNEGQNTPKSEDNGNNK